MKVIHVNQVNENIEIQFRIMNGAQPFNVPEGVSCTIRGTKGDNFGYAAAVAVTAGSNIVTVTLTEQLTAVAGAGNIFELVFVGASDDMKVSTENFLLDVERAALGEDTVISDSDLAYADQVLDQLQSVGAVNAQVQQNKANIAAEITRATAAEQTLQQNINAEAAARQAADNTLQSNINAEASSRATTDASLQSQINQLVAPSGEAPSAAEVQNARIGTDGTVYPTLGDAIRTQNSLLKSQLGEKTYNLVASRKNGYSIGSNGKINANATTDILSAPVTAGTTYYITTDEASLICGFFTSNPFDEGATSYNSSRTIQNQKYITAPITGYIAFRVLTGYQTPQITEGNTELPYFPPYQAFDRTARAEIAALSSQMSHVYDSVAISIELKNGYIRSDTGAIVASSSRQYGEFPVSFGESVIYRYTYGAEYHFGLAFYDISDAFISGYIVTTLPQTIAVPQNAYICRATVETLDDISVFGYNSAISNVEQKQKNVVSINYDAFIIHDGYYANYRNMSLSQLSGIKAVEFPVFNGITFNYLFTVDPLSGYGLYFIDAYGNGISPIQTQTTAQTITAPRDAVKCFATISDISQIQMIDVGNAILARNNVCTPGLYAPGNPLDVLTDYTGMLDLFLHVGCIGDSLASGESYWNDGGTVQGQDFYQYSWGQFLARKTGNTYYNWSKGGLMAKTWLESEYATECFDGNHKCEAYIIGLGQNDRNHSVTIGTSSDIDLTDYHNNADTFYGNYGKIIQKIKEIQPQAKIFVITDPNPYVNRDGYNVPIADMPNIFDNVYLIDMYRYGSKYYNNEIIMAQMRGSHYNAYGYKLFSMMIANYINWIITNNYAEFRAVELIGTGHSWVGAITN